MRQCVLQILFQLCAYFVETGLLSQEEGMCGGDFGYLVREFAVLREETLEAIEGVERYVLIVDVFIW